MIILLLAHKLAVLVFAGRCRFNSRSDCEAVDSSIFRISYSTMNWNWVAIFRYLSLKMSWRLPSLDFIQSFSLSKIFFFFLYQKISICEAHHGDIASLHIYMYLSAYALAESFKCEDHRSRDAKSAAKFFCYHLYQRSCWPIIFAKTVNVKNPRNLTNWELS